MITFVCVCVLVEGTCFRAGLRDGKLAVWGGVGVPLF